jgi:hypothetical protein
MLRFLRDITNGEASKWYEKSQYGLLARWRDDCPCKITLAAEY